METTAPTIRARDHEVAELRKANAEILAALKAITKHEAWRHIPIDTHNCHLAITACEELDDLAREALRKHGA